MPYILLHTFKEKPRMAVHQFWYEPSQDSPLPDPVKVAQLLSVRYEPQNGDKLQLLHIDSTKVRSFTAREVGAEPILVAPKFFHSDMYDERTGPIGEPGFYQAMAWGSTPT